MSDKNYSPEVADYYQLALKTIEVVKRERDRLKARVKTLEDALGRYAHVRDGYGDYSAKQALAAKECPCYRNNELACPIHGPIAAKEPTA